jgi:oligopeptide transport system substrate-binding protein
LFQKINTLCLIFCLIFFCGCQKKTKPFSYQKLHLAIAEDPLTLDPRKGGDALSSHLHFLLFEGLVKLHPDGSTSPAACSSYTVSEDKKTYTFFLGKTTWSDGSFITSTDFEKAWKAILSPSFPSPNAHLLYPIKNAEPAKKNQVPLETVGIYAPNPTTLIVELENPTPYFLELISFCVFSPVKQDLEEIDPDLRVQAKKPLICNGPFCLAKWSRQSEITLSKNPYYHSPGQLDAIHLQVIRSEMSAVQMYKNGELDLVGDPFLSLSADLLPHLPKKELLYCPVGSTTFISFNTSALPFSNKNIRKAFALSINRKEIIAHVAELGEQVALCAVAPNLKKNKKTSFYEDHDLILARKYFEKGLQELQMDKKGLQDLLLYQYSHSAMSHKIAQILQQQWKEAFEILVPLQNQDHLTLMSRLTKKNYVFAQTLYRAQYLDPLSILERFQYKENVKNYPSWENERYIALLKSSALLSRGERILALEEAEALLLEEMPFAPLFHGSLCYLKKNHVQGVELSPSGGIFFERLFLKAP